MDENSLFACLDDDLRFEEPVRKKKRSSILKQTKQFGSEVCDVTEVEIKKGQKAKRVSFANKFQVKEMNTGNIYDIPGQIETPRECIPSEHVAEAAENKENLGILLYPESFSMAQDFSFNQLSAVNNQMKAKDSLLVYSPASDDMELTQMDKSFFLSLEGPVSENGVLSEKTRMTQKPITEIKLTSEKNILTSKNNVRGGSSTLPDMDVTFGVEDMNASKSFFFSPEIKDKFISKDYDSLCGNILGSNLDTTCLSLGLSQHRKSNIIFGSSMLHCRDADSICDPSMHNSTHVNKDDFDDVSYQRVDCCEGADQRGVKLKRKLPKKPQSSSSGEKEVQSFPRHLIQEQNVEVANFDFKTDSPSCMELTCVSTKGGRKDSSLVGVLAESALQSSDLDMTSVGKGETDIFHDSIMDGKFNSPSEFKNKKVGDLPGILRENAQLDMTYVGTVVKNAELIDCNKSILNFETNSPYKYGKDNDLLGIQNVGDAELDMTCVATVEKNARIIDNTYDKSLCNFKTNSPNKQGVDNGLPGILIKDAQDVELNMTCVATIGDKAGTDDENTPENTLCDPLQGKAQGINLDMTCVASAEKTGDIFNENILASFGKHGEIDHTVGKGGLSKSRDPNTLHPRNECDVTKDLVFSVNADLNEPFASEGEANNILGSRMTKQSQVCCTNAMEFTCADVSESYSEEASEPLKNMYSSSIHETEKSFSSSCMDMTCPERDMSLTIAQNEEFMKEKLDSLNTSLNVEYLPEIVIPKAVKVNEIFHDEVGSEKKAEAQYSDGKCLYGKIQQHNAEDSATHNDSELMQLTCATLNRRSHPELDISAADDFKKENIFKPYHAEQDLTLITREMSKFDDRKSLKRSCTDDIESNAGSFSGRKTKSLTPAVVYRMRRTKVITEDVQGQIYLSPELEEAVKDGNTLQDESMFSINNLKNQKPNSVVKQSVINTTKERELFSSSILLCNEETVHNISSQVDSDRGSCFQLVSATHKAVPSEIFSSDKVSESALFSNSMLQLHNKSIQNISCKPVKLDRSCGSKPVLDTPKEKILNANSLTASESQISDHRVESSSKVSCLSEEDSMPGCIQVKNASLSQEDFKLKSAGSSRATTSDIFSANVLTEDEIKKPDLHNRETEVGNMIKDSLLESSPSKEEPFLENLQNSRNQHNPKLKLAIFKEESSRSLCCSIPSTTEVHKSDHHKNQNAETKQAASQSNKKESMSGGNQLKNADSRLEQSESRNLSLRDKEKPVPLFYDESDAVPTKDYNATKIVTPKSSSSTRKQTATKIPCFKRDRFNSGSAPIHEKNNPKEVANVLTKSSANPKSKNSPMALHLDQEEDLVSSSSICSNMIPYKLDNSISQSNKPLQNVSRNILGPEKFFSSFSKAEESMVNYSHSLQLLPESILDNSISLCGLGMAQTLLEASGSLRTHSDHNTITEGLEDSVSSRGGYAGQGDDLPEMKSPNKEADSVSEPSEQNKTDKFQGIADQPSLKPKTVSPVKASDDSVESNPDSLPVCNHSEMDPVDINLSGAASSKSSAAEPAQNSLLNLREQIEEASGSKKRWFLLSLHETQAVFKLNMKSYLFWCRLRIQVDQTSSTESRVSFSYKSRGEEIEDFGYNCFLNFVSDKCLPFPPCSQEIIKKMEEYVELARRVELLMNDFMHLVLTFDTTVSEDFNPIKIKADVFNEKLITKFSLMFEVDFYSYPQKLVPTVAHLRLRNHNDKVREAVAKVEPGPQYLWKMACVARSLSY